MLRFRNPLVAICRFWYTGGNGIHSPFAYQMVTQVIDCPGRYYADSRLYSLTDRLLRPRLTAVRRLLFRLANYWQPSVVIAPKVFHTYLHEGCLKAQLQTCDSSLITFEGKQGRMIAIIDLQRHKTIWHKLKAAPDVSVTFDLYDIGIAFFLPKLQRQNYIINW